MLVTLFSGHIQGVQEPDQTGAADVLDRAVMLVYTGTFLAMDGPVTITEDHLIALAAHHNARFDVLTLAAGGAGVRMKDCPPIQLDHSTSARDTVGRVYGRLSVGDAVVEGVKVRALFGNARFIGQENITKAKDGRFTNVSIGADLETNFLKELSVTPFPAAAHASLLTQGASMSFDKAKMKKHLTRSTKCSDEEADEKLAKMSDDEQKKLSAEADEEDKKLAAEEDEKAKKLAAEKDEEDKKLAGNPFAKDKDDDKEDDKDKKLAAQAAKITKLKGLVGEASVALTGARVEMRKGEVANRLAKLRAGALMTPATEKKLTGEIKLASGKAVRLAEVSDDTLELVFAVLEAGEPVVHVGQLGSLKAVDLAAGGGAMKTARLAAEEQEHLSNMPFTSKLIANSQGGTEAKLTAESHRVNAPAIEPAPAPVIDETIMVALSAQTKKLTGLIEAINAAL